MLLCSVCAIHKCATLLVKGSVATVAATVAVAATIAVATTVTAAVAAAAVTAAAAAVVVVREVVAAHDVRVTGVSARGECARERTSE